MEVNQVERWSRLALGAVVLLFTGIIYAWAILKAPFASEFAWGPAALSWNYTLAIVSFCLFGFIAGQLSNKTSPRARLLASAALLFGGFLISSRLSGQSIVALYISYGVIAGGGVGISYTTVIGLTNAWFPDKRGLCSGILMMSFGLTSLLIGNLADMMIKSPNVGWRMTLLLLAVAEGVILVVAALLIRAPGPLTTFPVGKATPVSPGGKPAQDVAPVEPARDYTVSEMVRRPSFWLIFAFMTMLAMVGSAAIALASDILKELGVESPAAIIGVISIMNGIGRLVSGALYDGIGIRKTQYVMSAVAIAAPATVAAAILGGWLALGLIGLALCYFSYGFTPTTSSVFASTFYGMNNFPQNFSVTNLVLIPAPFAAVMAGTLFAATGSFIVPFVVLTGCSVVGLFINLAIKTP
jgi:OFA family oxalate/formate antiporter-like MFS transporter